MTSKTKRNIQIKLVFQVSDICQLFMTFYINKKKMNKKNIILTL